MIDEADEGAAQPTSAKAAKTGGKLGLIFAVVITAAVVGAGAFFAPRYLAIGSVAKAEPAGESEPPMNPTVAFQPIVVDIRQNGGETHHLKVTLTFELADHVKSEEFEKHVPPGREAAIMVLRGLSYDEVTSPAKFSDIVRQLNEKVLEAIGKKRVRRMMITDFVTQ